MYNRLIRFQSKEALRWGRGYYQSCQRQIDSVARLPLPRLLCRSDKCASMDLNSLLGWVVQWISEGSGPGGAISVCVCVCVCFFSV